MSLLCSGRLSLSTSSGFPWRSAFPLPPLQPLSDCRVGPHWPSASFRADVLERCEAPASISARRPAVVVVHQSAQKMRHRGVAAGVLDRERGVPGGRVGRDPHHHPTGGLIFAPFGWLLKFWAQAGKSLIAGFGRARDRQVAFFAQPLK
jgi:hypothetical protein